MHGRLIATSKKAARGSTIATSVAIQKDASLFRTKYKKRMEGILLERN